MSCDEIAQSSEFLEADSTCHPLHPQAEEMLSKTVRFQEDVKIISYEFDARMRKHIWYRVSLREHLNENDDVNSFY